MFINQLGQLNPTYYIVFIVVILIVLIMIIGMGKSRRKAELEGFWTPRDDFLADSGLDKVIFYLSDGQAYLYMSRPGADKSEIIINDYFGVRIRGQPSSPWKRQYWYTIKFDKELGDIPQKLDMEYDPVSNKLTLYKDKLYFVFYKVNDMTDFAMYVNKSKPGQANADTTVESEPEAETGADSDEV